MSMLIGEGSEINDQSPETEMQKMKIDFNQNFKNLPSSSFKNLLNQANKDSVLVSARFGDYPRQSEKQDGPEQGQQPVKKNVFEYS